MEKNKKKEQEYLENWKRERAAFLNYKKEEAERVSQLMKYANEELLLRILPILDNIDIAQKKIPQDLKNNQWVEGLLKIKVQILDLLKSQGVKEIESLGKKFDPHFQEAVGEAESDSEQGTVVEEVKKGYLLHNKVLRASKVKLSKGRN